MQDTVSVIDPVTQTVVGDPIALGDAPFGVAFDGTNVYIINFNDNSVTKLLPR